MFGTPAFMPPEQALGRSREVDALSDLWAVGATAFTLLSGRYVHSGQTAEEMLVHSATRPAPPLVSVAPHVPLGLAQVIDRALAFEKADRWPSALAMREALARVRGEATPMPVGADDWEDAETRLAPPPQMTMRGNEASRQSVSSETTLALPTLHAASTVAGVASHSEARRVRRERRLIGAGAGGLLILVVVGIIVALAAGSKGSLPNVPATASVVPPATAVVVVSTIAPALAEPSAIAVVPPAMSAEVLPVAPPTPPPRALPTAAGQVAATATAAARPMSTAPPMHTSVRQPAAPLAPKRDPLAP